MRNFNPSFSAFLLAATVAGLSAAAAAPVLVSLEGSKQGGLGPLSFVFDSKRQAHPPYDFADVKHDSWEVAPKSKDLRIRVEDYFRVEMDGWTGYGFNWLLQRTPGDAGAYEEYCEVRFFKSPEQAYILKGAWTSSWSVDAPVSVMRKDGIDLQYGEMRVAGIGQPPGPPAVPEPGVLALFAGGLLAMAGAGTFRLRRRGGATPPPRRTFIGNLRYPAFILAILLGGTTVQAAPILVTLGDPEQTGIGPLSFIVDTELQPLEPYDFDDYFQYTGDYVDKQDDYSIQVRDYYRVEMDDANGFGYNWHLESSPPGIEFSEKYTHIRVFNSLGQTLDLQTGPWPDSWNESTVFYGFLYYDIFSDDRVVGQGNLPIVEIRELATPAIPEPASLALFTLGLGTVVGMAGIRHKRRGAPAP